MEGGISKRVAKVKQKIERKLSEKMEKENSKRIEKLEYEKWRENMM